MEGGIEKGETKEEERGRAEEEEEREGEKELTSGFTCAHWWRSEGLKQGGERRWRRAFSSFSKNEVTLRHIAFQGQPLFVRNSIFNDYL